MLGKRAAHETTEPLEARVGNAVTDVEAIAPPHLAGKYTIEVVDLRVHPQLARGDQIIAIPTLVRKLPQPIRKVIGDLSNEERTLVGLQLRHATDARARS
jgi:circadian clock protein KaiB